VLRSDFDNISAREQRWLNYLRDLNIHEESSLSDLLETSAVATTCILDLLPGRNRITSDPSHLITIRWIWLAKDCIPHPPARAEATVFFDCF
jgi:hypothetical protein